MRCSATRSAGSFPSRPGTTSRSRPSTACSRRRTAISSSRPRWTRPGSGLRNLIGGDKLASDTRFLDPASRNANRLAALAYVRELDDGALGPRVRRGARRRGRAVRAGADASTRCSKIRRPRRAAWWSSRTIRCSAASGCLICRSGSRTVTPRRAARRRSWASTTARSRATSATRPEQVEAMERDGVLYAEQAVATLKEPG